MSAIDALPADQRAAVQLILAQGRSYDELAGVLGIEPEAVRRRAHAALDSIGPGAPRGLTTRRREELADYLLGQLDADEADDTRHFLQGSASGRAWARVVAAELGPIARSELPEIPDQAADAAATNGHAERGQVAATSARVGLRERRRSGSRRGGGTGGRRGDAAGVSVAKDGDDGEPADRPRAGARAPRAGGSRLGGIILLAGVAVVVAVIVFLLIDSEEDDKPSAQTPANAPAQNGTTGGSGPTGAAGPVRVVAQVNMRPPTGGSAVAIGQVFADDNQMAILIQGQKFPPNQSGDQYAVWLTGEGEDPARLGFAPRPVAKNGQFVGLAALPDNPTVFDQVLVTRETTDRPEEPGDTVVAGPLDLTDGD